MKNFLLINCLLATLLLVGCSSNGSGATEEEMKKFISDSEFIHDMLFNAYSEGRDYLTDKELQEMIAYEVAYDAESDFQKAADDSQVQIISTTLLLMRSELESPTPITHVGNNKNRFFQYHNEVKEYLKTIEE